jgi:hypothetical protein
MVSSIASGTPTVVAPRRAPLGLCRGEWVEVLGEAEILATLDDGGMLEALPFMPEMRGFCGRRFRVSARAERTSIERLSIRRMNDAVHLEGVRCDGAGHDGCARRCLIFWKEAWLRRADPPPEATRPVEGPGARAEPARRLRTKDGDRYVCQATELCRATRHLPAYELRRHLGAIRGEGVAPLDLLRAAAIYGHDMIMHRVVHGPDWNTIRGPCKKTPSTALDLEPGERVRVKGRAELIATLDENGWNRKMELSREQLAFCGKEFTVLARVDRIIRDHDARMVTVKNTVILDGLVYKDLVRLACPRSEYIFWRECWLERVEEPARLRSVD